MSDNARWDKFETLKNIVKDTPGSVEDHGEVSLPR
jgi:hypothetical protein